MSYPKVIRKLVKAGKSAAELKIHLLNLGFAPCVAREMAREPARRIWFAAKEAARAEAHRFIGKKLAHFRRIIRTIRLPKDPAEGQVQRDHQFHATKGWRTYAVAA